MVVEPGLPTASRLSHGTGGHEIHLRKARADGEPTGGTVQHQEQHQQQVSRGRRRRLSGEPLLADGGAGLVGVLRPTGAQCVRGAGTSARRSVSRGASAAAEDAEAVDRLMERRARSHTEAHASSSSSTATTTTTTANSDDSDDGNAGDENGPAESDGVTTVAACSRSGPSTCPTRTSRACSALDGVEQRAAGLSDGTKATGSDGTWKASWPSISSRICSQRHSLDWGRGGTGDTSHYRQGGGGGGRR